MNHFEHTISSKTVFEGRIFTVFSDEVVLENEKHTTREIVHHNGGACVAALNATGEVLLTSQFRYAYRQELLELPAGKLEKGENPFVAAKRELAEETGFSASDFIDLGVFYPTCGYCDEIIYLYGAKNLQKTKQNLDEDEFITVSTLPLSELCARALSGEIVDGKTAVAALRLKNAIDKGLF